jgi:cell wall-associated NlpC family hydrolase
MQIPNVSAMFQSRAGSFRSRVSADVASSAGSFAEEFNQVLGAMQGQADYNLQQLTIVPDSNAEQKDATQGYQAANTFSAYSTLNSVSSAVPPLYIPAGGSTDSSAPSSLASKVISYAEQFLGTPYVWGGEDLEKGADCSGFTQSVFAHFGVKLPRTAYGQSKVGTEVDPDNLQPGDLLFFKYCDRAPVTHVAMYIGNGKIIEEVSKGLSIKNLSKNWKKSLVVAKRIL